MSTWLPASALESLAAVIPVVVGRRLQDAVSGTDSVRSNDEAGAAQSSRRAGLRDTEQLIGPDNVDEEIDRLLRQVRAGDPATPTALFASNDIAAVPVMHRAADLRVSVPKQLSIVGYDSSAVALTIRPHLTSINQPREAMGRLAAQMVGAPGRAVPRFNAGRRAGAAGTGLHGGRERLTVLALASSTWVKSREPVGAVAFTGPRVSVARRTSGVSLHAPRIDRA